MLKRFDRLRQRLSDPLLTVLTLMLSFLLFVLGPMQAAGVLTGQHFGYFFGLVLLPAAFLYSRNLFVAGPIAVAMGLVVTAALLEFERSSRTDLYLDSAAWLVAGLALSVGWRAPCSSRSGSRTTALSAQCRLISSSS